MKLIVNCETGIEQLIELSKEDIAQQKIDEIEMAKPRVITDPIELARLESRTAAEAKLAALGLTAEDLKALGL